MEPKTIISCILQNGNELSLAVGDISLSNTDAIVNAANTNLQYGGGVAKSLKNR